MGMAAILVMVPKYCVQTFVPQPHGGSTCNLVSTGPVVSEELSFENVDTADTNANVDTDNRPLPIL